MQLRLDTNITYISSPICFLENICKECENSGQEPKKPIASTYATICIWYV